MSYQAPIKDMLFCMTELAGLDQVAALPGFEDAGVGFKKRSTTISLRALSTNSPRAKTNCAWGASGAKSR